MLIIKIILCSRWKGQQRPFYGSLKALQSSPMEMEKRFFPRARLYEPINNNNNENWHEDNPSQCQLCLQSICRPKTVSPKFLLLAVNWHSLSRCDWEGTRHCCCRQATTRTGRVLIFFLTLKTNVLTSKANVLTLNTSMVNLKTTFLLPTFSPFFSISSPSGDCLTLSCVMDPKNKMRPKNNQQWTNQNKDN